MCLYKYNVHVHTCMFVHVTIVHAVMYMYMYLVQDVQGDGVDHILNDDSEHRVGAARRLGLQRGAHASRGVQHTGTGGTCLGGRRSSRHRG